MSESQNEILPSAAYLVLSNDDYAKCEGFTIGRRLFSVVCHPEGHVVAYFVSSAHKREAQEYAHSRALASRDDAVRELVQAARQILMKPRECAQNNFGVRVLISDCGRELDALHAALANPALVDLH